MAEVNLFRGSAAHRLRQRFGAVPRSAALQLLPAGAAEADWHTARWGRVGASELPTIVGVEGAYGSPFALWWAKKQGWTTVEAEEMAMGSALEPVIGQVWQDRNPDALLLRPGAALYGHPTLPWLVCTPDYLAVRMHYPMAEEDRGGGYTEWVQTEPEYPVAEPVECKAYDGGTGWGKPGTAEVPPHIDMQVRVQCAVLGAARGHVVRMRGKKVTTYTVDFDGTLPQEWTALGERFWRSLTEDTPPPLDGTSATEAALGRLYADMDVTAIVDFSLSEMIEYQLAMRAVRDAKARKQAAVNKIRARLGTAKTGQCQGETFVERRVYKRAAYEVPAGVVDALYPKGDGHGIAD